MPRTICRQWVADKLARCMIYISPSEGPPALNSGGNQWEAKNFDKSICAHQPGGHPIRPFRIRQRWPIISRSSGRTTIVSVKRRYRWPKINQIPSNTSSGRAGARLSARWPACFRPTMFVRAQMNFGCDQMSAGDDDHQPASPVHRGHCARRSFESVEFVSRDRPAAIERSRAPGAP